MNNVYLEPMNKRVAAASEHYYSTIEDMPTPPKIPELPKKSSNCLLWFIVILLLILLLLVISIKSDLIGFSNQDLEEQKRTNILIERLEKMEKTFNQTFNVFCPNGWKYLYKTSMCYQMIPYKKTFVKATEECRQMGAKLVSIHSDEENKFISELANTSYVDHSVGRNQFDSVWIGMTRNRTTLEWSNLDGSATDYSLWADREPSNSQDEFCAELIFRTLPGKEHFSQKWTDRKCTDQHFVICAK